MSQKVKIGIVGKSSAFYTQMEARIKAQVIAEIQREYPEVMTASDTLTAIFYEGAITGSYEGVSGKVLFTNIGGVKTAYDFAQLNADLPEPFASFFETGEFGVNEINLKDKVGVDVVDGDGNVIKEYKTKYFNHPVFHKSGVDLYGNNYELWSIAKYGTLPDGYEKHHAFIKDDNETYFDSIFLSTYPLSEILDGNGNAWVGSFKGKTPIGEVDPIVRIQPERSYYDRGWRWEWDYYSILCTIIYGDRAMGYQDNASLAIQGHFAGNALDVNGYRLNSTGNSNSASNTFCVNKQTNNEVEAYATLQVGADVTFLNTELYASYGNRANNNTSVTRKITQVEDMGSYIRYTFDGDAYLSYNKWLHCNYFGNTGVTDSINHLSGYRTEYPDGYKPFKLLNIENPFGMYATWLDWIVNQSATQIKMYEYGLQDVSNRGTWSNISTPNVAEGWVSQYARLTTTRICAFIPNAILGSSVTYYMSRTFRDSQERAMIYGRDNRTDYKHGVLRSFTSCYNNPWTDLANSSLYVGCWGRVYRSASH